MLCVVLAVFVAGCPAPPKDEPLSNQPVAPPIAAPAPAPKKAETAPEDAKPKGPESETWWQDVEKNPVKALKTLGPDALSRKGPPVPRAADNSEDEDDGAGRRQRASTRQTAKPIKPWPPRVDQPYPNIELKDHNGALVSTREFLGKVVLVEVMNLGSEASHALAGGNKQSVTRFRGVIPRRGLDKVEAYVERFAQVDTEGPDVVFIRLVIGGMELGAMPNEEDVHAWAQHFGVGNRRNNIVLVGDRRVSNPYMHVAGPTFHLIDRKGIMRAQSYSYGYTVGLNRRIIPTLQKLVKER